MDFLELGGGLLIVPFLENKIFDVKSVRATSVFCTLILVLVSSIFFIMKGKYDISLSVKCILGGVVGSFIGTKLLIKLNKNILNVLFIIFLFYSGIKMVIS